MEVAVPVTGQDLLLPVAVDVGHMNAPQPLTEGTQVLHRSELVSLPLDHVEVALIVPEDDLLVPVVVQVADLHGIEPPWRASQVRLIDLQCGYAWDDKQEGQRNCGNPSQRQSFTFFPSS